jgi:peptidoglycan/xylan/chitin deacetylase (PgdA/CDA1 family)
MPINKRKMLLRGLKATGGLRLLESKSAWSGLLVLNYHRIGIAGDSLFDRALWSASQEAFGRQVQLLKRSCEVVGLDELPDVVRGLESGRRSLSSQNRFAMITFDDGYLDNFEQAFPVLKSNDVPGVFFIATGFVDEMSLAWWDEISWMVRSSVRDSIDATAWLGDRVVIDRPDCDVAIRRLLRHYYGLDANRSAEFVDFLAEATGTGRAPRSLSDGLWMNWDQIRQMRAEGMSIAAHTVTHPVLAQQSPERQSFEICESKLCLERELGEPITALSYPVGRRDAFNQATRTALTHHGIEWGFSYYGGFLTRDQARRGQVDRLDIPRVAVESDTTFADFRSYVALPQVFSRH